MKFSAHFAYEIYSTNNVQDEKFDDLYEFDA